MFGLVVRFEIFAERAEEFDHLMGETVAAIRTGEPGTHVYVCCRVDDAPTSRVFFELYADRAAFDAHERTPATLRFLAQRTTMIAASRVEFLTPYEMKIEVPFAEPAPAGLAAPQSEGQEHGF